jgi:predicted MPP superfamily phosphohydrolase
LADRTLYDIVFTFDRRPPLVIAPHAVYARSGWHDFGLIHATDLHASGRVEGFRDQLTGQGKRFYTNFNDGIRDLITEANRLYREGQVDVIIATGDLVDYAYEDGPTHWQRSNFYFLQRILCGDVKGQGGRPGEELLVPIFMAAGNHDYRQHPYKLFFTVDVAGIDVKTRREYECHHLTDKETIRIEGGQLDKGVGVSKEQAFRMLKVDKANPAYRHHMVNDASYIVRLGRHRVVMLDTRWDRGAVTSVGDLIKSLYDTEKARFVGGSIESQGLRKEDIALVERALVEAGPKGLVIVGMHAPPVNTAGNEYPCFFRETLRPHAQRKDIEMFLNRQARWVGKAAGSPTAFPPGWLEDSVAYFKKGSIKGLDFGIARGQITKFLGLCVGRRGRPIDLVLCGHTHRNVEYRIKRRGASQYLFFMDFYTENPRYYYVTHATNGNLCVEVDASAGVAEQPVRIRDARKPWKSFLQLRTPPYPDPLSESLRRNSWWERHRPLIVQTSSVGPTDAWQREQAARTGSTVRKPEPTFRGFRVIRVRENVIHAIETGRPTVKTRRSERVVARKKGIGTSRRRARVRDHRGR